MKAPGSAAELHRALLALARISDPLERRLPLIELLEAASRKNLAPEDMFTGAENRPVASAKDFNEQPGAALIVVCDDLGRGKIFSLAEPALTPAVQKTLDLAHGAELEKPADSEPAVAAAVLRLLSAGEAGVGESYDLYEQWLEAFPEGEKHLSRDDFDAAHRQLPLKPVASKDGLEQRFVRIVSIRLIRKG